MCMLLQYIRYVESDAAESMLTVLPFFMFFGNSVNIREIKCDSFDKIQVLRQNCQQKWIIMESKAQFQSDLLTKFEKTRNFVNRGKFCMD